MAAEHVIADAWNLVHFHPELRRVLNTRSPAAAAAELERKLEAFCTYGGGRLSVVYDGGGDGSAPVADAPSPYMERIYTPSSQTADEYIEKFCAEAENPSEICVVTADRLLALTARSFGARAVPPYFLFSAAEVAQKSMAENLRQRSPGNEWLRGANPFAQLSRNGEGGSEEPLMSKRMKKKYRRRKMDGEKKTKPSAPPAQAVSHPPEAARGAGRFRFGAPSAASLAELEKFFFRSAPEKRGKGEEPSVPRGDAPPARL